MSSHTTGLAYLPTELYNAILTQLEIQSNNYREFRQSLLALSRAIPRASLPLEGLYRLLVFNEPSQAHKFYLHLRRNATYASAVQTFKYESFEADADIVVNLLNMLHAITDLTLFVGPNFAPEHLEDIFENPRSLLKSLSLRFRP